MADRNTVGNWQVRVECVVVKSVYVTGCTEEQARTDPFAYSQDELEIDQRDWKVEHVEAAD